MKFQDYSKSYEFLEGHIIMALKYIQRPLERETDLWWSLTCPCSLAGSSRFPMWEGPG